MPEIVIFTHAPQKTLGDPSSAAKLQRLLMDKLAYRYKDLVVKVVVSLNKSDEASIRNLFQVDMPYELIDSTRSATGMAQLEKTIKKTDIIISYPTPHFLTQSVADLFTANMKPVIALAEYDYDMEFQLRHRKSIPIVPGCFFLSSGLGKENLGIYIETFNEPAKVHPTDFSKLPSDLLSGNKEFYFGYFNRLFSSHTGATPSRFIAFAIHCSHQKDIDIILPLQLRNASEISEESKENILLSHSFMNDLHDFDHVLISYFPPNSPPVYFMYERTGKTLTAKEISEEEFEKQKDKAQKIIRIINPFPLHKDTVRALVEASAPVNLLTGDQSFSEALSLSKIAFYQTMPWKQKFYEALTAASAQKYTTLHEWFKMVGQKTTPLKSLVEFYKKNKEILYKETQALRCDLEINKNLSLLFLDYLDHFLQNSTYVLFTQFIEHLRSHPKYYTHEKEGGLISKKALFDHINFYFKSATSAEEKNKMFTYFDAHMDSLIKLDNHYKIWFYHDLKTQHPELQIALPANFIIEGMKNLNLVSEEIYYNTSYDPVLDENNEPLLVTMVHLTNHLQLLEMVDINVLTAEDKLEILQEIMRGDAICKNRNDNFSDTFWLKFLEKETDARVWRQTLKLLFTTPCYSSLSEGAAFYPDEPSLFFKLATRSELTEMLLKKPIAFNILMEELFLTKQPVKVFDSKINEIVLNAFFSISYDDVSPSFFRSSTKFLPKGKELLCKVLSVEDIDKQTAIKHFFKEMFTNHPQEINRFNKHFAPYLPQYLKDFINERQYSSASYIGH
ncbi:hypothetical protein FOG18_04030 [Legionella israelensis]|uniref:hypothetical protein n=1 Tax=Legionella israelensis TaxID=454 RepID=UPI00117FE515|nr:hypothetical protein [Legionella israelensis]QDP71799.1 hypothetical protein FOG18_04030 [Legionella israelensis]